MRTSPQSSSKLLIKALLAAGVLGALVWVVGPGLVSELGEPSHDVGSEGSFGGRAVLPSPPTAERIATEPRSATPRAALPNPGAPRSRVVDLEGTPVPSFALGVNTRPKVVLRTTNARGEFRPIPGRPGMVYESRSPGWRVLAPREVGAEGTDEVIAVPTIRLTGRLVTPTGGPVIGSVAYIIPSDRLEQLGITLPRDLAQSSNAGGRFELTGLPVVPGSEVRARATSYEPSTTPAPGISGDLRLTLVPRSRPGPWIRGVVLDQQGKGVQDAIVVARGVAQALSDSKGAFTLGVSHALDVEHQALEVPGRVDAFAQGQGHGTWTTQDVAGMRQSLREGTSIDIEVRLTPSAEISGRLIDQNGQALADWAIEPDQQSPVLTRRTAPELVEGRDHPIRTDATGSFHFTGLNAGESYRFHAHDPTTLREGLSSPIPAGTLDATIVLELLSSGDIRGRILDERGLPAANVPVALTGATWATLIGRTRSDAKGAFLFSDPPAGMQVTLRIGGGNWSTALRRLEPSAKDCHLKIQVERWLPVTVQEGTHLIGYRSPSAEGFARKTDDPNVVLVPASARRLRRVGAGPYQDLPDEFSTAGSAVMDL